MDLERIEYRKTSDGQVVPRQNQGQFLLILAALLASIFIAIAVLAFQRTHAAPPETRLQIMAAQVFVRSELQPAGDDLLRFSPPEETDARPSGKDLYRVTGWVDLIAADGHSRRFDFSCTIQRNPSGDWVKQQLTLFPQA